jgi:hypothetical protein
MYNLQRATKNTPNTSIETIHSSCTNENTLQSQPENTYTQVTKQNSYARTNIEQEPHTNQSHQHTCDIQDIKSIMKSLFE